MIKLNPVHYCDICGREIKDYDPKMHQFTSQSIDVCYHCQVSAISTVYAKDINRILSERSTANKSSNSEGRITLGHTFYASGDIPGAIMTEHY